MRGKEKARLFRNIALRYKMFWILSIEAIFIILTFTISFFWEDMNIITGLCFSLFGLTCLFFLLKICFEKYITNNFDKKAVLLITTITSVLGLIYYCVVIYSRSYEYISDYTVYYDGQADFYRLFSDAPMKGFASILFSCWKSDYSFFINIFTTLPFYFTTGTHDAYTVTYYIFLIIPVIFAMNIFVTNFVNRNNVGNKTNKLLFLILCNFIFLTFPLVNYSSILGMPDLFGMCFVFLILLVALNYDFTKANYKDSCLLAVLLVALTVTRRWYLFFIIGFVFSYFLVNLCSAIIHRSRLKVVFLNEIKTAVIIAAIIIVSLAPFIYHTLFERSYKNEYAKWYHGGFFYEIFNQIGILGILVCLIILAGIIYGLINKLCRLYTIIALIGMLVTMLTFTYIQNMGMHQSLCLIGYYLIFIYNSLLFICRLKNRAAKIALVSLFAGVFLANIVCTYIGYPNDWNGIYLVTKQSIISKFTWK